MRWSRQISSASRGEPIARVCVTGRNRRPRKLICHALAHQNTWHLLSADYPPTCGGVSDYTHLVAAGLAAEGDEVHVWCRFTPGVAPSLQGVHVHRILDRLGISDIVRLGQMLDEYQPQRRLLVQWVPHAFGFKSMNLPLCAWLWYRARVRGDHVEVMVHEPFLAFGEGTWRQSAVAVVHRAMMVMLLGAARRVWVSIPKWEECVRPYLLWRRVPFAWLPIPSSVPPIATPKEASAIRTKLGVRDNTALIGHFGTYGRYVVQLLERLVPPLMAGEPSAVLLFMGRGGLQWCEGLIQTHPELRDRVRAVGPLPAPDLSCHLAACDLIIQPYPDGVSSRRTSAMAALAHGKPLVTNRGHLTEPFWSTCGAVSIAPAGPNAMCAMINAARRLLRLPQERTALGRAGAELYRRKFDVSYTVATLRAAAADDASSNRRRPICSLGHQCG